MSAASHPQLEARLKAILEQVRLIEIRTRRFVDEALGGSFRSVFRGRGMDFDSVREYIAGDDVRAIDWNVTARAGRPFIKKHHEERELNVLLLIDVSASGDFGSGERSKRDVAAEIASVLALSATRNHDRVSLLLFSDRVEGWIPPGRGRAHAMRVVREILTCTPEGKGTDLAGALEVAAALSKRRAIAFLISDFQLPADVAPFSVERALGTLTARHDVVAIGLRDPRERELPSLGVVVVEDAESGEVLSLNTNRPRLRERYKLASAARWDSMVRLLRRARVDVLEVDPTRAYLSPLLTFFRTRERARR